MTGNGRRAASEPPFDVEAADKVANRTDEVRSVGPTKAVNRVREPDAIAGRSAGARRGPAGDAAGAAAGGAVTGSAVAGSAVAGSAVAGSAVAGSAVAGATPAAATAPLTWRQRL